MGMFPEMSTLQVYKNIVESLRFLRRFSKTSMIILEWLVFI
jgi:hypothetical protein